MKTSHIINAAQMAKTPRSTWNMIKAVMRGEYKPSLKTFLYLILLIIYVVFPIDILPDFIPILGWVDDGVLLMMFISRLNSETEIYNKKMNSNAALQVIKK